MHIEEDMQQVYTKIKDKGLLTQLAELCGMHRNTVRRQFKGEIPLKAETVKAATELLAQVKQDQDDAKSLVEEIA